MRYTSSVQPFRWDLSRVEQLGKLIDPDADGPRSAWASQIMDASVKIVARSNGANLVFVGRSPENFFDYLSGVFASTPHGEHIHHFNVSNRFVPIAKIRAESPKAYEAIQAHATLVSIDPAAILKSADGICFVDLVASGSTFGQLLIFLIDWANELGLNAEQVLSKIHFVGITTRTKSSPNTMRWQQHADWVHRYRVKNIKNVSVPRRLWDELGNDAPKVTRSNGPRRWAEHTALGPDRDETTLAALQLAYQLYSLGVEQRREFARKLAASEASSLRWGRAVLGQLR